MKKYRGKREYIKTKSDIADIILVLGIICKQRYFIEGNMLLHTQTSRGQ